MMIEPAAPGVALPHPAPVVDLIIPVYRGLTETRRCLESVWAFPQQTPHEIVVINDCSPEPEVSAYLRELAETGAMTLLENPVNTGFVNTVNRGLARHLDRDVVLLNSDTEVHGDWLDRLRHHAESDPSIGTVTPFSNNATICSYPRFGQINALPSDESLQTLDTLFAEINRGCAVEIPTAVGFCVYITRRCLNQVGYFDARLFSKGYGEENDFSMRGMELGFKHLLGADVFVYHKGSVSFRDQAERLCAEAQLILQDLHPHYLTLISDFFTRDPLRILRRRIDLARLSRSPRRRALFITHSWGGGTEKHVQELAKLLGSDFEILILRPTGPTEVTLEWSREGEEFITYFSLPYSYAELVDLIGKLQISRLHYHHVLGLNQQVLQLPKDLGLPYDFTLHDYYPICPQYNLADKNGKYCGEPDATGCAACLAERPTLWGMDILSWRALFKNLLTDAERVIVPSQDALARVQKYIPDARYLFLPHPEFAHAAPQGCRPPFGNVLKVLVLGKLSLMKGLKLLEACALDAKLRDLPLYFRVIGFPDEEIVHEPAAPLSFYGSYDDARLPSLIALERADLIFFPALWPETYSYTLSYAMRSGLPIAAPRLGAFIERLADYQSAWLLDWKTSAECWNDFFVSFFEKNRH